MRSSSGPHERYCTVSGHSPTQESKSARPLFCHTGLHSLVEFAPALYRLNPAIPAHMWHLIGTRGRRRFFPYDQAFWSSSGRRPCASTRIKLRTVHRNAHLIAEVGGLRPGRALDAGCGHGTDTLWLAAHGWFTSARRLRDATVATWDAKYFHNKWRPVTEIQGVRDATWLPFLATPNHPEYPSSQKVRRGGHADLPGLLSRGFDSAVHR